MAILAILTYPLGWTLGWPELMIFAAAQLLALLLAVPFVVGRHRWLVERTVQPRRVSVGDPAVAELRITNPTGTPVGSGSVQEWVGGEPVDVDVSGLARSGSLEVVLQLPTSRRGLFTVGPTVVAKGDPLGLLLRKVQQSPADEFWVRPRVVALEQVPVGFAQDLEGPTSDCSPAGDVSFHALREYEIGDDHRHVHWLSTARTGTLMVRHHVDNRLPALTIVLDDCETSYSQDKFGESSFETAVEAAASLVVSSIARQQPTALLVGEKELAGHRRLADDQVILDDLTVITAGGLMPLDQQCASALASQTETSVLVVVTGRRTATELMPIVQRSDRHIHLVFVRMQPKRNAVPLDHVPGAITFDVASLREFQGAWNRRMR